MIPRVGLVMLAALLSVTAQTGSDSNSAYRRFQAVQSKPEGVRAAEDWLQIYERQQPNSMNVPPYLTVARFYVSRSVHMDEIPALLEKAAQELATPGGFTEVRVLTNSPFQDDIDRGLIANVYTQIRMYDRAHALLDTVSQRIAETKPETLDAAKVRIFPALLFSYRDPAARLAVAENRKEDALAIEHAISPGCVLAARAVVQRTQRGR
jgi:hypothetical protein